MQLPTITGSFFHDGVMFYGEDLKYADDIPNDSGVKKDDSSLILSVIGDDDESVLFIYISEENTMCSVFVIERNATIKDRCVFFSGKKSEELSLDGAFGFKTEHGIDQSIKY